jgi:diguanylate cyclase (GGDEF)-like protein
MENLKLWQCIRRFFVVKRIGSMADLRRVVRVGAGILVCLLAFTRLGAQEYDFQYFVTDQGLTSLLVQNLYQDQAGFLWVATQNGVFRYDGERFQRFGEAHGLPALAGAAIGEAADGTLLVGGTAGLFELNGSHFENVPLPDAPSVNWVGGVISDGRGRTYLATSKGLMVLTGERRNFSVRAISNPAGVSGSATRGIFVENNAVWYGCGQQLCRLSGDNIKVYGPSDGIPPASWMTIGRDLSGDLWVQGRGAAIEMLPPGASTFTRSSGPLPSGGFTGVPGTDGDGFVLFPAPDGLVIRRKSDWWKVGRSNGLRGTAYSVLRDREGSLWIGLEGQGLVRWAGYPQWEAYTENSSLGSDIVFPILPQPDGSVWLGTESGLFRGARRGQAYVWAKQAAMGDTPIISMVSGPDHKLWLGTESQGIAHLDPAREKLDWFGRAQGLTGTSISVMLVDRRRRIWAATENGMFVADAPYRHFAREPGLPQARFWAVTEGSTNEIWAGGDSGLFRMSAGVWRRYTKRDGLSHDEVIALGAARDGTIWAGYRFGGEIDKIVPDGGGIRVSHDLKLAESGASMTYFFGFDARNRLWAGTNRGVDVWDGESWTHIDSNNGLVWDDCDGNGFAAEPDGSVWIGTSNGLAHFTPWPSRNEPPPPAVVFTRLTLGGKDAAPSDSPIVKYRSNDLVVQYSALDFAVGSSLAYRYRLLPLFSDWRTTGQRELEFPGLPSGSYRLEVEAQDPWSNGKTQAASFLFKIQTPWFKTWWFVGLALAVSLCLMVVAVFMRLNALNRRAVELLQLVEQRTADLKKANEALYRLSSVDALTGIANRRVCDETLRREWVRMKRSAEPLSAVMFDVDHFKKLNDADGHQRGDECLVEIAREMQRVVRRKTDLAARYGGEEFVVVLPGTCEDDAVRFAEHLRASIEQLGLAHPASPVAPVLTVSAGVGTAGRGTFADLADFMAAVDRALYAAKERGRNCVVASSRINNAAPDVTT